MLEAFNQTHPSYNRTTMIMNIPTYVIGMHRISHIFALDIQLQEDLNYELITYVSIDNIVDVILTAIYKKKHPIHLEPIEE